MKKCNKCNVNKKVEEFGIKHSTKDHLNYKCIKCESIYQSKYWALNKERFKEKRRNISREKYWNDLELGRKRARESYIKNKSKHWKERFEILNRDKFTCQYCGRKAPDVILQVDHIYPKSKGGKNVKENYITACQECNIGKSNNIICTNH